MRAEVARLDAVRRSLRHGGTALDGIDLTLESNRIHALLGRNGAGKSTLLRILAGQQRASAGEVRVFGADPFDNVDLLPDICLVRDEQEYPDATTVGEAMRFASYVYARWDTDFADRLLDGFRLRPRIRIDALSRGQRGAVGLVVGLASRARLTLLDEPYLGLDSLSRRFFADELLSDFTDHPRTVVLSTHQVDEFSGLIERVVLLDEGRVWIDADADDLRGSVVEVSGRSDAVDRFCVGRNVLASNGIGDVATAVVVVRADEPAPTGTAAEGVTISSLSLQTLTDGLLDDQSQDTHIERKVDA